MKNKVSETTEHRPRHCTDETELKVVLVLWT